ncbi:S8 family serine peptidase [Pleionea sediminis]|uniref:S8 family serine peptidase n=1 Tax=Pleionea sediminis TaxID=2569479 RepID=UPI001184D7C7|nr:S8 family serine peptidase [Pleionea sediminis]
MSKELSKRSPFTYLLTSTAVCASLMMSNVNADTQTEKSFSPSFPNEQELVVKFKSSNGSLKTQDITSRLQQFNIQNNSSLTIRRSLASGAQLIHFKNKQEKDALIAKLESRDDVEYAVPNYRLYTMKTPDDSRYNEQWHYFESAGGINAPAAWDINEGNGAVVAVIDTGYRPHVDLVDNIIGGYDFISDPETARDGDGRDSDASDEGDWWGWFECPGIFLPQPSSWHGTHVAGTIAAVSNNGIGVAGVAPKAKVVPIRALGKCGGTLADIQDSILWAAGISVSGTTTNEFPADVINMSLGGGAACDAAMQDVINQATAAGSLVVAASGNSNADASGFVPASCDNVLTVSATNRSGGRANYSNFGDVVEVSAPGGTGLGGDAVLSTLNTGAEGPEEDTYRGYQGTSMSAPHASGVAALLFSKNPSATPAEVIDAIVSSARAFPATCNGCGSGIIDAFAALEAIGGGTTNQPPSADFSYSVSGLSVSFTDGSSDSDGNVSSWSWDFGDGNSSSDENPSHTYASAGSYTVTLTVEDDDGATDRIAQSVTVEDNTPDNQAPSADFTSSARDLSVQFQDQSDDRDGNVVGWAWDFGDGNTSSDQNPVHDYANAGTYTVTLTVTDDDGATNSTSQQIEVTEAPAGDLSLDASVSSFWFIHTINLSWSGADNVDQVDIYRNGTLLATTANDGAWSERRFFGGSGTYSVCEAGTQSCSNEVTVNY